MTKKFEPQKPQEQLKSFLEVAAMAVVTKDDLDQAVDGIGDSDFKELLLADIIIDEKPGEENLEQ